MAADVYFTPPLKGPSGVWPGQRARHPDLRRSPSHAKNPDAAKEFILHLTANYAQATNNSELYTFPAFPETVPQLNGWLDNDPYGSKPANKLALLKDAEKWSTTIGHPGPANAAMGEVFGTFILPQMMAKAARGELTPPRTRWSRPKPRSSRSSSKWRKKGLVGGDR